MTHHITDEQIDELLYTLNDIASAYNSDEYGLPLGCSDIKEQPHDKMRAAIRAVLTLAAPAPAVPSDELRIARGAIRELEQKVFSQEQAIAVLRASVARYQRDMEDPPAYLQDAVIRAAGLGAMAEEIAALKKKLTAAPTPPAQPAVPSDELPEIGSFWKHTNGNVYKVLSIANEFTQDSVRYPKTVVYQGATNSLVWARAASDWHRSMTLTAVPTPKAKQPVEFEGNFTVGHSKHRGGWFVYKECGPGEYTPINGPFASKDEADAAMRGPSALPIHPQPAVPEDVAREPMAEKWCWWIGDDETFHVADTEDEAHGEARCRIDDDCMPGYQREYSVARVQHPIDSLGMDWLAKHVAETIEAIVCEWCDDNNGAEDPSITLAAEDRKVLGTMVAAFLREKVSVHWWTADQKTITTHTYVAGSNDADAARAAEKGGE